MDHEQAATIFQVLWLLYRRMVAGKDQRRDLTKAEREWIESDVPVKVERQGVGICDVQAYQDEDGKRYVGNLDWRHALRWSGFNANMKYGQIIELMCRLKNLNWAEFHIDPPDLEILKHSDLFELGLNSSHVDTLVELESMQQRGLFESFRKHLLKGCPHLANLVKSRKRKCSSKGKNIGIRGVTNKQRQAMDLKERGFTLAQIAEEMNQKHESSVIEMLKRGKAAEQRIAAEIRRERASGRSIRPNVSLDSHEGGESKD